VRLDKRDFYTYVLFWKHRHHKRVDFIAGIDLSFCVWCNFYSFFFAGRVAALASFAPVTLAVHVFASTSTEQSMAPKMLQISAP